MSLSTTTDIFNNVKFNTNGFSFAKTLGTFINNVQFSQGYREFLQNKPTKQAFIWETLSAIGDDIGETVYDNIQNYINFVSNVDICKVYALRSMMNELGFTFQVFDKLDSIPAEIINLMNVVSINRRYLLDADLIKDDFMDELMSDDAKVIEYQPLNISADDFGQPIFDSNIDLYISGLTSTLSTCIECIDGVYSISDITSADYSILSGLTLRLNPEMDITMLSTHVYMKNKCNAVIDYDRDSGDAIVFNRFWNTDQTGQIVCGKIEIPYETAKETIIEIPNGFEEIIDESIVDTEFITKNADHAISVRLIKNIAEINEYVINDDNYVKYIASLYATLLSDFVTLQYNVTYDEDAIHKQSDIPPYVYVNLDANNLSSFAEFTDSSSRRSHLSTNISPGFNESKIVDDIDNGNDSLDNYTGNELKLINEEIDRRAGTLTNEYLKTTAYAKSTFNAGDSTQTSIEKKTQYSYYRRAKVKEYISFIQNKFYTDTKQLANLKTYDIDPSYLMMSVDETDNRKLIKTTSGNPAIDIDFDMINAVALSLAQMTMYIVKLREKIKLQTRKNYMKGTNSLLLYIINEYLVDFARHNIALTENSELSAVKAALSSHNIDNLHVIEYWDKTPYFNLSTETTISAMNSSLANYPFWKKQDELNDPMNADGLAFKLDEINNFYVNTMMLKNGISSHEMLNDFLNTVYQLGANTSYIDEKTGLFSTMLSDGYYSAQIYDRLVELSNSFNEFHDKYSIGFDYPPETLCSQIDKVVNNHISSTLYEKYTHDVSDVYNSYHEEIDDLSNNVSTLTNEYDMLIYGEYAYYFVKSDNKYCYEDPVEKTGYKHDWFVGNPEYLNGQESSYIYNKINQTQTFAKKLDNIKNYSIIDTANFVLDNFNTLSISLKSRVINQITSYGFTDINAPTLDTEMQFTYDFIDAKIKARLEYLQNKLDMIRTQALDCQTQLNSVLNSFGAIVATYSSDNDLFYRLGDSTIYTVSINKAKFPSGYSYSGRCKSDTRTPTTTDYLFIKQYSENSRYYYAKREDQSGDYAYYVYDILKPYNESDSLFDKIEEVKAFMSAPTTFVADSDGGMVPGTYTYGLKSDGTMTALDQIKANYSAIEPLVASVIAQFKELGGVVDEVPDLQQQIIMLIEAVNRFDESKFEDDLRVKELRELLACVTTLSAQFLQISETYNEIYNDSEQQDYLAKFVRPNDFTAEGLTKLLEYANKTDTANKMSILNTLDSQMLTYMNLQQRYYDIATNLNAAIQYQSQNTYIELQVDDIMNALVDDMSLKYQLALEKLHIEMKYVNSLVNVMSNEISTDIIDNSNENFEDVVKRKIKFLNFFENDIYNENQEMFLTYAGNDICYAPYANFKNMTHPTYQVHPFLWMFIEKDQYTDALVKQFDSVKVDDLLESRISKTLYKYIGEFGQTIDIWKHNIPDFSGYITRYESSQHKSSVNRLTSDVIDYDGAFYPPALDMLKTEYEHCISSIHDAVSLETVKSKLIQDLQFKFSNPDNAADFNEDDVYVQDSQRIFADISAIFVPYFGELGVNDTIEQTLQTMTRTTYNVINVYTNIIQNFNSDTYYGKYYAHLNIGDIDHLPTREYICHQYDIYYKDGLSEQRSENLTYITDIIANHTLADIYDIYRYGIDMYGNMYILYKQYFTDTPTYKQKQNTKGELWIRLKDHPVAFPAFAGEYPAINIKYSNITHSVIRRLTGYPDKYPNEGQFVINDKFRHFFDFEFTKSLKNLSLMTGTDGVKYSLDPKVQTYGNCWIMLTPIKIHVENGQSLLELYQPTSAPNGGQNSEYTDFIRCGSTTNEIKYSDFNNPEFVGTEYQFIGTFLTTSNVCNYVYVKKHFTNGRADCVKIGVGAGDNQIVIIVVNNGNRTATITGNITQIDSNDIANADICFSYDETSNKTLTFAVLTKQKAAKYTSGFQTKTLSSNVIGPVISDPTEVEMNSHDVFTTDVTLVKTKLYGQTLIELVTTDAKTTYNQNADMSYIPLYPGILGEINISSSTQEYPAIELLGRSKNIDAAIGAVNINPDPYFDYNTILSNDIFGRVYQDYIPGTDKTYTLISNPSIHNNKDNSDVTYDEFTRTFIWNIDLTTIRNVPFTDHDYDTMNVLMYKQSSLGKNPYIIANLSSIQVDDQSYDTKYYDVSYNSIDDDLVEFALDSNINIVGTLNHKQSHTTTDTNHINGIKNIQIGFIRSLVSHVLQVRFIVDETIDIDYVHVNRDNINVILFNEHDLTLFKYYHLLDAYGVIHSQLALTETPADVIGDHVKLIYERSDVDMLDGEMHSYFIDKYGVKRYFKDIELSDYSSLSDIEVFKGDRQTQFKYDEELHFEMSSPMYYYPTLNVKYPFTPGMFIKDQQSFSQQNDLNINFMNNLFDETNLFIMNPVNPYTIASNIPPLKIPYLIDNVNCYRAYEDYLDIDDENIKNNTKFDIDDPRIMQFIHNFSENTPSSEIAIDVEQLKNQTIDSASDMLNMEYGLLQQSSEQTQYFSKTQYVIADFERIMKSEQRDKLVSSIAKILRVYVNYKKTDTQQIQLYFNYFNYLNSPFIKIEDDKEYVNTIPSTYLMLKPGETGSLDIIMQLRHNSESGTLGYDNVTLVTYEICNISDDKPKFTIKPVYMIDKMNIKSENMEQGTKVQFNAINEIISLDDYIETPDKPIPLAYEIGILADNELQYPYTFSLNYPNQIMNGNPVVLTKHVVPDFSIPGIVRLTVEQPVTSIMFNFELLPYIDLRTKMGLTMSMTFEIYTEMDDQIVDIDDNIAIIDHASAILQLDVEHIPEVVLGINNTDKLFVTHNDNTIRTPTIL